ncbi:hypothetical protein H8Z59_24695 [Mycolicibacterium fortuitum]|uniref:hypothetical protein n=1 Tax=Mycolicibacterium fortuitum TaxID=1766 RepID=UPI001CDD4092|nr:hypothetical protein [Mycolicibacterium fortuitum]UBV20432.1 hypothetical protein H8Z59_24695 [Mycolicibacterium fortuitum]
MRTIPAPQLERFDDIEQTLRDLYPGPEHDHEYQAAIEAAATYLIGAPAPPDAWTMRSASRGNADSAAVVEAWSAQLDTVLGPVAEQFRRARAVAESATAAARTLAILAGDDGLTEVASAQRFGVDRTTLRRWRGKNDRKTG